MVWSARINIARFTFATAALGNWFGDDPSAQPCTTAGVDNGVCAFGVPALNTFGTSRNGSVRGPGFHNVDMSAMKDFRIVDEHSSASGSMRSTRSTL